VAKRTVHMLIDDIDGGEADETITFALDGTQYEIDLSKKNAAKMRDGLARYIDAGTRIGRGGTAARATARATTRATAGRGRGAGQGRPRPEPGHPRMGPDQRARRVRPRSHQAGNRRPLQRRSRPLT
jgi:hypothetical protein